MLEKYFSTSHSRSAENKYRCMIFRGYSLSSLVQREYCDFEGDWERKFEWNPAATIFRYCLNILKENLSNPAAKEKNKRFWTTVLKIDRIFNERCVKFIPAYSNPTQCRFRKWEFLEKATSKEYQIRQTARPINVGETFVEQEIANFDDSGSVDMDTGIP